MDTEKQRQCRRDDSRLTKSGNARSEQLLVVPTESLTHREWLPGELLSGSEHRRPDWYLDMKYQTCFWAPGNETKDVSPEDSLPLEALKKKTERNAGYPLHNTIAMCSYTMQNCVSSKSVMAICTSAFPKWMQSTNTNGKDS